MGFTLEELFHLGKASFPELVFGSSGTKAVLTAQGKIANAMNDPAFTQHKQIAKITSKNDHVIVLLLSQESAVSALNTYFWTPSQESLYPKQILMQWTGTKGLH